MQTFLGRLTRKKEGIIFHRRRDDPVFDPDDVPYETIENNPYLQAILTDFGGHVGFIEGQPGRLSCWAERQAARFLAFHLLKTHFEAPSP